MVKRKSTTESYQGQDDYLSTRFQARLWQGANDDEYRAVKVLRNLELEYGELGDNRRQILTDLLLFYDRHQDNALRKEDVIVQAVTKGTKELLEDFADFIIENIGSVSTSTKRGAEVEPTVDEKADIKNRLMSQFLGNINRDKE